MPKTTITTREYDDEGRLVREVVSETDTPDSPLPILQQCNCGGAWWQHYCPLHGWVGGCWTSAPFTITCGTDSATAGLSCQN